MILNLRPSSNAVLSAVIEDMEERFSEDEQNAILAIIGEVLGHDDSTRTNGDPEADGHTEPPVENGAS